MVYDLIIIGGGPAGITAGIYAARQKLNILLITKDFRGQIAKKAVTIENYPGFEEISGMELVERFEKHLRKQEIDIEMDMVRKVAKPDKNFLVHTGSKKEFRAKAVIVASGADPRLLEIPGEKEFIGKGISYCAVCDGVLFADKTVAVIGGGNTGFESAIFLSNYVKKIYILEYSSQVSADEINQERVKRIKKAKIIINAALKKIEGNQFVESIVYEDKETKEEKTLLVEGVFVEIGSQPATSFIEDLVEFNEKDEIKVEFETYQTKTAGLFAIGDVNIGRYKQIITACGEGAKAALTAYGYIQNLKLNK